MIMEKYNIPQDTEIVSEPKLLWGGRWTDEKLDAFEKYVRAYLTIMNKYRHKYNWKLLYFDGFAGSGTRNDDIGEDATLYKLFEDETITEEQLGVYKGAAERVVSLDIEGFDKYYFVDLDKESNNKLKERLSPYDPDGVRFEFRNKDANDITQMMGQHMAKEWRKWKGLVLLDPFGMSINWSTIESLKNASIDLWILVPTGVIINRLLERDGSLKHIDKLKSFFGMTKDEISDFFNKKRTENTLFGEVELIEKVKNPIQKIAELYVERLKKEFKYVTESPLVLTNNRGVPIFHFVFASNNQTAVNIAQQIIKKKS